MKKSFGFLMVMVVSVLAWSGCMRNDDEPPIPTRPISRLYLSIEDYEPDATRPAINNIALIDPADTTNMSIVFNHDSGARGGSGIHFSPQARKVFHASRTDTLLYMMNINEDGQLGSGGSFGNRLLNGMRGLAYHYPSEMLYVADVSGNSSHIYGFHRPANRAGHYRPDRKFQLESGITPFLMTMWADSLLVSNLGENGDVLLYGGLSQTRDSMLVTDYAPDSRLTIEGVTSIRGIAFVDSLDLMVVADYGTSDTDGKVHIIQGVKAHFENPTSTVTPTRTISGPATGLVSPVDVAIDPRDREGGRFIYVADQEAERKLLRFRLTDNGNREPEESMTVTASRTPFSMFLDARGEAQ